MAKDGGDQDWPDRWPWNKHDPSEYQPVEPDLPDDETVRELEDKLRMERESGSPD